MSGIKAGRLRHRIDIDRLERSQDTNGVDTEEWSTFATNVPAKVAPLSAKEFIAAQQVQSQVVAKVTIRYRKGVEASMRIKHRGAIYNIAGVIPDDESGLQWLTLPVSAGVNAG